MVKNPKRPRDVSQLAKMMIDVVSGEGETFPKAEKANNPKRSSTAKKAATSKRGKN